MKNKIKFIAEFPPPINGRSIINQRMNLLFKKKFDQIYSYNLTGHNEESINYYIYKLFNMLKILFDQKKSEYLYISISANFGIIYDFIIILFLGFRVNKIFIHHHNFNYCYDLKFLHLIFFYFTQKRRNILFYVNIWVEN